MAPNSRSEYEREQGGCTPWALAATAEQLAREITDPGRRAQALTALAAALIDMSGGRRREDSVGAGSSSAVGLLAEIIGTTSWQATLPVVGQVALPALLRLSDVFLTRATPP